MKPIETIYKGFRFRSRLEARWAVFYDALGIQWEYEKEGYDLGNGILYLPDFYIPHLDCWIEIKGEYPKDTEKIQRLSEETEKPVYLFVGQIPNPETLDSTGPPYEENESAYLFTKEGWDAHHVWCECPECHKTGIEFDARSDRLPCKEQFETWDHRTEENLKRLHSWINPPPWYEDGKCRRINGDKGYNGSSKRLINAYFAARSARFEFGGNNGNG